MIYSSQRDPVSNGATFANDNVTRLGWWDKPPRRSDRRVVMTNVRLTSEEWIAEDPEGTDFR